MTELLHLQVLIVESAISGSPCAPQAPIPTSFSSALGLGRLRCFDHEGSKASLAARMFLDLADAAGRTGTLSPKHDDPAR